MKKVPYKLRVADYITGLIRTLHPNLKKKVRASLKAILSEPLCGKSLKDERAGLRSFRVSKFRIIYSMSKKKEIEVVAIDPRERICELIKKDVKSSFSRKGEFFRLTRAL
jgi:mRNA interferase RelE/StbE